MNGADKDKEQKIANPYGLDKDELAQLESFFLHPGWQILNKRVYPKVKESILSRILDMTQSNDLVNICRGELRALNDFINAPLVAFKIKRQ